MRFIESGVMKMANEKRLIDANAFFDKLEKLAELMRQGKIGEIDLNLLIAATPTVDAVEVVHGRWEEYYAFMSCSVCDRCWYYTDNDCDTFNYCPNCGAKMDGGNEDG